MKTSLFKMLAVVAVPSMLAIGCGGSSSSNNTTHDLAVNKSGDMAAAAGDMAAATGCTAMTFPADSNSVFASLGNDTADKFDYIDDIASVVQGSTSTTYNDLSFSYWHTMGNPDPTLPLATTYSSTNADTNSLSTCAECLTVQIGTTTPDSPFPTQSGPPDGKVYLAMGGTTSATKLDKTIPTGTITVSGSNINLVEWDAGNDVAVANGGCIDVASFSFTASYNTSTPDGGSN